MTVVPEFYFSSMWEFEMILALDELFMFPNSISPGFLSLESL